MDMVYIVSIWLLPVLIAITFHEAAHGYVGRSLGDETASRLGRVSLNPLRHIDPFGTILLPGPLLLAQSPFLFGYAKPVPVNFGALRNPRIGMVLVAAAGPAMNKQALGRGAALAALQKSDNPSDLRYQQRGKKSFYRFSIIYRPGIGRHMRLGFESISAFGAGPKIEDKPLAHVFRPFGDK